MTEKLPKFSLVDWERKEGKKGYTSLLSKEEVSRLEIFAKKGSDGWRPVKLGSIN